jgi:hypothetical protein
MVGQIIFTVIMLAVFVGWMFIKPGKSIFDK